MITIGFEKTYNPYIIRKGSVAINGVSLTIVDDLDGMLIVSLIPLTQSWTNLGTIGIGESVNLEFDMMGKYIEKMINQTRNHPL